MIFTTKMIGYYQITGTVALVSHDMKSISIKKAGVIFLEKGDQIDTSYDETNNKFNIWRLK